MADEWLFESECENKSNHWQEDEFKEKKKNEFTYLSEALSAGVEVSKKWKCEKNGFFSPYLPVENCKYAI